MTNLQGCINFLLPPGPKFIRTSHHCFLQSVLFLELSWRRHDFIVSNCIGHNGIGLWTSNKDSDMMGLVLASTLASNVRSDSSFRLVPCILSSANNIEWAHLIWRSQTPPLLLAVGGYLFHWIHWPPAPAWTHWFSCASSLKMSCSVMHWPQQTLCCYQSWRLKYYLFLIQIFEVLLWRYQQIVNL